MQRGREEVRVYVRVPETQRDAVADIRRFPVRLPGGGLAELGELADIGMGESPSTIRRKDGQRVITVGAKVRTETISANEVTSRVRDDVLPTLRESEPDLDMDLAGEQEAQAESLAALQLGFLLALLMIYALLAIPFRSYLQPLVIMAAIPFGIIGAFAGHLLLGLPVGILSLFGIIGLSGVMVNDALVMTDFINERIESGDELQDAIIGGAKQRFRPIMLTSLTTFLSVAPLTFEQSLQAQFLVPMAASLGFGILVGTMILMLLVPALAIVQRRGVARWYRWREQRKAQHGH